MSSSPFENILQNLLVDFRDLLFIQFTACKLIGLGQIYNFLGLPVMPDDCLKSIFHVDWAAPEEGIFGQNWVNLTFILLVDKRRRTWRTLVIDSQIPLNCLIIIVINLGIDVLFCLTKFDGLQILLQNSQENKLKRQLAKENKWFN